LADFFGQNNIQYELIKADQMENTPGSIYMLGRSYGRKLGKGRCGWNRNEKIKKRFSPHWRY